MEPAIKPKPGVTTHYIDQGIDTGSILGFQEVKINANENLDSLRQKIVLTGCKNLFFMHLNFYQIIV